MTITATSVIKKILVLFLVFAGLYYAQDFLIPLVIGGVLAILFLPFSKWMENNKVPKGIAVLICLMIFLLIIAAIGTLLGWQILELVRDFDLIKERAVLQANRIQQYILINYGVSTENHVQAIKNQQSFFTDVISSIASSITSIAANFVLILVYIFCLIYYRSHIKNFLINLSPPSQQKEMEKIIYHTTRVSQQYLLGLFKMITILWVMYFIGFSVLGVKNALFFAILCGLLEIIPFIGNITGTIITLLVAAVNGAGYPMLGGIVLTYSIVQLIQGWILEPLIVGTQVKINPLSTIIALVIPGIFIAIPLIAMFKIVCDHVDSLKPYGSLIG